MKRVSTLLLLLCLLSFPSALAEGAEHVKLTVPFFCQAKIPTDVDLVEAELNDITRVKIGVEIELIPLLRLTTDNPDPRRQAEMRLLEMEGTSFDIFLPSLSWNTQERIPLDDLLEAYGQDIVAVVGEKRLNSYRVDGALYYLPSACDYAKAMGISMRKDILEKYNIDVSQIQSIDDLWPVFELVHENEPDMGVVSGYNTQSAIFSHQMSNELITESSVVALSGDDANTLICYYESNAFRGMLDLTHAWYEADFLYSGMALQNTESASLVKAGELFSYFTAWKPGVEWETSNDCGMEMVTVQLTEPLISNRSNSMHRFAISKSCAYPEKAMQYLNLLYSDADVVNLLAYGIEGIHYVVQADGTIDYPDGVTAQNTGFINSMAWSLPNQLVSHVWSGNDVDLWQQLDDFNHSAACSPAIGFNFDIAPVAQSHAAVLAVRNKYLSSLERGLLDPAVYLPKMLEEMEEAGLDRVLKEAQRQYDQWHSTKGEWS